MRKLLALGLGLLTLLSTATVEGAPKKRPYSISMQALQDANQTTDVYVTLKAMDPTVSASTLVKHLQMKSLDVHGDLLWTANEFEIPFVSDDPSSPISETSFTYPDMVRYQSVQAQAQVQNGSTTRTEVLRTKAPVLLRPDLKISSLEAERTVRVGEVANIAASITELNGDLGATAKITLNNGTEVLDTVNDVVIGPNGNATVVFSTIFQRSGDYTLTVAIAQSEPGCYSANDSRSLTLHVTNDVQAAQYSFNYWFTDQDTDYTWSSSYGSGHYAYDGQQQQTYYEIYLDAAQNQLQFPLQQVTIQLGIDGLAPTFDLVLNNIAADNHYDDGYYSHEGVWRDLGNGLYFYAYTYNYYNYYQHSYASVQQYAADYVYFSESHDYYWGSYSNSDTVNTGTFLNPTTSLEARLVVTSADGSSYGGSGALSSFQTTNWDDIIDYNYGDYSQTGYNRGSQIYGYTSGTTTP